MINLKSKIRNLKIFDKLKNDTHLAELIKGSGIAFILKIIGFGFGYIFTLLVTRTLGAKAWGIFALCMVVLQISSVIGRLGMDTALLRFTAEFIGKNDFLGLKYIYKKMINLVIPFSIILSILVFYLSPIISNKVFHKPYLTCYFRVISCAIFPSVLLWIHSEGIRGFKKIKEYMLLQQSGIFILATILFGILLLTNYHLTSTNYKLILINNKLTITNNQLTNFIPLFCYVISIIILSIIAFFLYKKYLIQNLKFKIQNFKEPQLTNNKLTITNNQLTNLNLKSKIYNCREILSVSIPMFLSSSMGLIMVWTDTIMLGRFRSGQEVGIYNVALRLSMITSLSLTAINTIAAPKFAEFWCKRDINGLVKVARQSTKLIFWITLPIFIFLFLFPELILSIFGKEFKIASLSLIILLIGFFFSSVCGSVGMILQMTGNQIYRQNIIFVGAVINILLNYCLIPRWGINGAALSSSITMIFWNTVFTFKIKHITGEWIFYPAIYKR